MQAPVRASGVATQTEFEIATKRARIRVKSLRRFYASCALYLPVNAFLWALNLIQGGKIWAMWATLGWGIGLVCWGASLYFDDDGFAFGAAWEERKVQELMARSNLKRVSREKELVQSQLRLLQAQIEPHFLFNTLANVQSLIKREPTKAQLMLDTFITYLRSSLIASRAQTGTLGQELNLLSNYLDLLKIRMGSRLSYSFEVADSLRSLPLAPMLLQPIVENAVRHGLEPKVEGGRLQLNASQVGRVLHISIIDDGLGFAHSSQATPVDGQPPSTGVGLANLRERLNVLFDGQARLEVVERAPGTEVRFELPV